MKTKRTKITFPVALYLYNGRATQPEIWFANSEEEILHWERQYQHIRVERKGVVLKINFKKMAKRVGRNTPKREILRNHDDAIPELLREEASPNAPNDPVVGAPPLGVQRSEQFYDGLKGTKKGAFF
ncbi:MAG: hypothetical protein WDZ93_01255 [Candidatus Paceibacterota bacterium]